MQQIKKIFPWCLVIGFFIFTFFFTSNNIKELDTYYHIKLGEIISQNGISNIETLYEGDTTRIWIPFEWSFQVILYQFIHIFDFTSIRYFIGLFATLQVVIFFLILKKTIKISFVFTLFLCLFYLLLNYPSFTARPQLWAYLFFNIQIYIIFAYLFRNKNFLFLSIPLAYLWSTFHLTTFFSPLLLLLFSFACLCLYIYNKKNILKKKGIILLIWSFVICIICLLPPSGILQYQSIVLLIKAQYLFSQLNELQPLSQFSLDFFIYIGLCLIVLIPYIAIVLKTHTKTHFILIAPLYLFVCSAFFALRNVYYGHIALLLISGWCLYYFQTHTSKKTIYKIYLFLVIVGIVLAMTLYIRLKNAPYHEPKQAINFLKQHIQPGPIFHIREYGGYFSYFLDPHYKIFIDGRVDASYMDRLPDYLKLVHAQNSSEESFSTILSELLDTHAIQTIILTYKKNELGEKILKVINNNPNWNVIFWDDSEVIFKKEKKTHPATPFFSVPYLGDDIDTALQTYEQIDKDYPSALSKNNIGVILIQKDLVKEAEKYFIDAIEIDPTYIFSYINLSLLSLKNGDSNQAITILKSAIPHAPNKAYLYLHLGKIYNSINQSEKAKAAWKSGLWHATTKEEQQQFQQLIQKE